VEANPLGRLEHDEIGRRCDSHRAGGLTPAGRPGKRQGKVRVHSSVCRPLRSPPRKVPPVGMTLKKAQGGSAGHRSPWAPITPHPLRAATDLDMFAGAWKGRSLPGPSSNGPYKGKNTAPALARTALNPPIQS